MIIDSEAYFEHHGVKGMKWGVRNAGGRGTQRAARKDAEEFARAKAYYGKGAGTRRKLINQTVADRSKRDPEYKAAFEKHLGQQKQSEHVKKAIKQRKRTDTTERTKQKASFLARHVTQQQGTQAAIMALGVTAIAFLGSPKGRDILKKSTAKLTDAANEVKRRQGARKINEWLNSA